MACKTLDSVRVLILGWEGEELLVISPASGKESRASLWAFMFYIVGGIKGLSHRESQISPQSGSVCCLPLVDLWGTVEKKLIIQWIFLSINKPFHSPLSEQKHPLLTPDTRPEELVCSPLNLSHWNCFREYNTLGDKKKKKKEMWAPCSIHQLLLAHLIQSGQLVGEQHTQRHRGSGKNTWSTFAVIFV